jgi:hypothetical protein
MPPFVAVVAHRPGGPFAGDVPKGGIVISVRYIAELGEKPEGVG